MAETIQEIMTANPTSLSSSTSVAEAALTMCDRDIGDVIVLDENSKLCGIVADRDIVVRAVAEEKSPSEVRFADICSRELTTIDIDASAKDAVKIMRERSLRRLPVMDHGKPAGIISLGDLAMERDPGSVLADISAAKGNA